MGVVELELLLLSSSWKEADDMDDDDNENDAAAAAAADDDNCRIHLSMVRYRPLSPIVQAHGILCRQVVRKCRRGMRALRCHHRCQGDGYYLLVCRDARCCHKPVSLVAVCLNRNLQSVLRENTI